MVLAVDEKSQMQALDRTAPMLPMMPGVPGRQTHDYIRHGTTSLFAALDVATGKVIGQHQRRHRHQEFLRFLKTIDKNTPADLDLHLICDNYATHKTPAIKTWLAAHPRFHLHFTPTSGCWLNLVERWFAELTNRKLRRCSPPQRQRTRNRRHRLDRGMEHDPKPFVWTKTADEILDNLAATAPELINYPTTQDTRLPRWRSKCFRAGSSRCRLPRQVWNGAPSVSSWPRGRTRLVCVRLDHGRRPACRSDVHRYVPGIRAGARSTPWCSRTRAATRSRSSTIRSSACRRAART